MSTTVNIRLKMRGRLASDWTSGNEVLLAREMGVETDTRKFKFGDGTTAWNSLAYASGATLGSGVETFLATPSSANLRAAVTDETGSGSLVFANTPTLIAPLLGTPTSGVMTNVTGLPLSTGVTGTLPVANGGTGVTTSTGTGNNVLSAAPTLTGGPIISGGAGFTFRNGATDGFAVSQLNTNSWGWTGLTATSFFNMQNTHLIVTGGSLGIGTTAGTAPTAPLDVNGNRIRIRTAKTPSSGTDTGNVGEFCWDANYLYICTATNVWERVAIATW
jgi:hypothetical protein